MYDLQWQQFPAIFVTTLRPTTANTTRNTEWQIVQSIGRKVNTACFSMEPEGQHYVTVDK